MGWLENVFGIKDENESVVISKKENTRQRSSSLTAVYGMNIVASGDHLGMGNFWEKTGTKSYKYGEKKKNKEKKIKTKNSNDVYIKNLLDYGTSVLLGTEEVNYQLDKNKPITYVMTYGKLGVGRNNVVYFPFLSSFEVKIMSLTSLRSINTIWNTDDLKENYKPKFDKNGKKVEGDVQKLKKIMNCIVTITFSVPGVLQSNEGYLFAMNNLALSSSLTSDKLEINYLNDSDKLTITDLRSFDFDSGSFSPINSNGFEDLEFTRQFVGRVNLTPQKIKSLEKDYQSKYDKSQKSLEIAIEQQKAKKRDNKLTDEQRNQANIAAKKLFEEQNDAADRTAVLDPYKIRPSKAEEPTGYTIKNDEYHYHISFLAEDIDFKNTYLAEDSAMEGAGLIQVLSVFNEVKKIKTYDYEKFDMKLVLPGDKVKNKVAQNTTGTKDDTVKNVQVPFGESGEKIATKTNDMFNSAMTGQGGPKAFNLTLRLPRAIMQAEIFQDVKVSGSKFGVYDGVWRIFQVDLTYEENGQFTQELLLHPKSLISVKNDSKINVKVAEYDKEVAETQARLDEELGSDTGKTVEENLADLEAGGAFN